MLLKIALVFLLLLPLLVQAQEYRISGRVTDAITKQPVPFASIGLRAAGTGALTDKNGYFQLLGSDKFKTDSLVFMTLGYKCHAVLVEPGQSENLRIGLSPGPAELFVKVGPCMAVQKAFSHPINEIIAGLPGTQYAFFIGNDKRKQNRKIRSVSFYVGENGLPMAPFRIRIYQTDGTSHMPAADLLSEQVVLVPTQSGQWFTSDLSRYNVVVPKEGYFVALQFENFANQSSQLSPASYIPSGQIMRPPFDFKKSSLWSYSADKTWRLMPQSGSSRRYNAMVKVEVEASE